MRTTIATTAALAEVTESELVRQIINDHLPAYLDRAVEAAKRRTLATTNGVPTPEQIEEASVRVIAMIAQNGSIPITAHSLVSPIGRVLSDVLSLIWHDVGHPHDANAFAKMRDYVASLPAPKKPKHVVIDESGSDGEKDETPRPYKRKNS